MLLRFAEFVKRPRTFWLALGAVLLLSLGFHVTRPLVGGLLLDEVTDSAAVLSMLSAMSSEQMAWHIVVTAGFDFFYPLAYVVLFAGLIIRGFGQYSPALLLPLVILFTAELVENLSQIALLAMSLLQLDDASLAAMAWVNAVASSSKFSMLYLTLGVVTLAVLGLAVRRVRVLRKIKPPEHRRNDG